MTETSKDSQHWTEVITAKTDLLDLRLGELWKYRDLLWLFVRRDFVAQYKQTILGPLWHIIQPLFTTVIFLFLFGRIANIPTDGIKPVVFYMSGITIWNYFSSCLTTTSNTFITNANIFGKVYFPRLVIPISLILSNIVRFAIQFGLLLILMVWYQFHGTPIALTVNWLCLPILVLVVAGIGLGLGIIISSWTTKYRDLVILLGFAVQLGMYATPIAYPLSYARFKGYAKLVELNPLTPVVEAFRYCLFGAGTFTIGSLAYSGCFMIAVIIFGAVLFNRVEKKFMDTV